jgi:hypothetical protein
MANNPGFDPAEIARFQKELEASGKAFQYVDEAEVSEEMAEFMFIGTYEGKPVIYDCLLGTLQLAYESNLLELAEAKCKERFPDYKGFDFEVDDQGQAVAQSEESEEVEAYKAYAIFEIEEAGLANVAEYVEVDTRFDYGVGLEAYLNVVEINEGTIARFIADFNGGTLQLDPIRYSFESDSDEDDD